MSKSTKTAYKLFKQRKNGTLGPLFINKRQVVPIGVWLEADDVPTKGYAHRPGWHCTDTPEAPHLGMKNRVWMEVEIKDYYRFDRPKHQGGYWLIAKRMKVVGPVKEEKKEEGIICPDCGREHDTYTQAEQCPCDGRIR